MEMGLQSSWDKACRRTNERLIDRPAKNVPSIVEGIVVQKTENTK